ncbi:TIGR03750 family conjugal transfer protein [Legionella drancourtii]|uniref:TIGR03750 family conjugal transfer protein n=1 Tax=Legionella drancourtii TaxID=168933 RepID=UPI00058E4F0F|nr:TIGR03750 family conjugal transfer protein [Legionella drancourtii]
MATSSSRHLSHDFPAYRGLTLRELFVLVLVSTPVLCVFSLFLGLFFGFPIAFGCVGLILGFILAVSVIPKPVARLKMGKPHGYLVKKIKIKLAQWTFCPSPYLTHRGHWSTSKRIGGPRV